MLIILQIVGPIQFIFTFHSVLDQNIHYLNDERHKLVAYYYGSLKIAFSVFVIISLRSFLPSHSHFLCYCLLLYSYSETTRIHSWFHLLQMIFKPSGPTFSIYRSAKSLHPQSRGDLIRGGRQTERRALGRSSSDHLPRLLRGICVMHTHTLTPILFVMVQRFQHNPALWAMAYISPKSQSNRHFNRLTVTAQILKTHQDT